MRRHRPVRSLTAMLDVYRAVLEDDFDTARVLTSPDFLFGLDKDNFLRLVRAAFVSAGEVDVDRWDLLKVHARREWRRYMEYMGRPVAYPEPPCRAVTPIPSPARSPSARVLENKKTTAWANERRDRCCCSGGVEQSNRSERERDEHLFVTT